jgi:GT2 family glycosyltransferase
MKKNNILFVITTYNQSEITKACLDSLMSCHEISATDILVVDDCSSDDTIELCRSYNVNFIEKTVGKGLTDSWNRAYEYFKAHVEYDYFVIANNDILVPNNAISEMISVLSKWPGTLVVPMSTKLGSGHNQSQIIDNWYGANEYDVPDNYQMVQDYLLDLKYTESESNNLYKFDPIRMKHFNGFFFMMKRDIIRYEREDGNLFDPEFINVKNEDEFNWCNLIPNDDYPFLCKTAFVFHWKGVSFTKAGIKYSNDLKQHLLQRDNK